MPVLKRQADKLGVSLVALSVRTVLERLRMTCNDDEEDDDDETKEGNGVKRVLLTARQRVSVGMFGLHCGYYAKNVLSKIIYFEDVSETRGLLIFSKF